MIWRMRRWKRKKNNPKEKEKLKIKDWSHGKIWIDKNKRIFKKWIRMKRKEWIEKMKKKDNKKMKKVESILQCKDRRMKGFTSMKKKKIY